MHPFILMQFLSNMTIHVCLNIRFKIYRTTAFPFTPSQGFFCILKQGNFFPESNLKFRGTVPDLGVRMLNKCMYRNCNYCSDQIQLNNAISADSRQVLVQQIHFGIVILTNRLMTYFRIYTIDVDDHSKWKTV